MGQPRNLHHWLMQDAFCACDTGNAGLLRAGQDWVCHGGDAGSFSACAAVDVSAAGGATAGADADTFNASVVGTSFVGASYYVAAHEQFSAETKMGQLPVAIDPFVNLVAGTGFEPVTFGL